MDNEGGAVIVLPTSRYRYVKIAKSRSFTFLRYFYPPAAKRGSSSEYCLFSSVSSPIAVEETDAKK